MAQPQQQDLWQVKHPELAASLGKKELKRQENIYELVNNQRNLVEELRYINDLYLKPLKTGDSRNVIPDDRRSRLLAIVFLHIESLLQIHADLLKALEERQAKQPAVETVSDLFITFAPRFEVLGAYAENRELQKETLDDEQRINPQFKDFISQAFLKNKEVSPAGKADDLKNLLYSPLQRFFKYGEFLRVIRDCIPTTLPDHAEMEKAVLAIKAVGQIINDASGRGINRKKMAQLTEQITLNSNDTRANYMIWSPLRLNLSGENRSVPYEGKVFALRNGPPKEIFMFLFDHMLVMATIDNGQDPANIRYVVRKVTIPLDLIRSVLPSPGAQVPDTLAKHGFTVMYPTPSFLPNEMSSEHYTSYSFATEIEVVRDTWIKKIEEQKRIRAQSQPFEEITVIPELNAKISCCVRRSDSLLIGTDAGLYVVTGTDTLSFTRVIGMDFVSNIGIVEHSSEEGARLFVLAGSTLFSFSLDEVLKSPGAINNNRGRKVLDDVTFFRVGELSGRTFVCAVRVGNIRSNIKLIDPTKEKKRFLSKVSELLIEKEFYIPTVATSIDFLKSKLVVGCSRGFEIVDLQKVGAASNAPLMDPKDPELKFMTEQRDHVSPKAVFKTVKNDYLLCFEDVALRVDRHGRRCELDFLMYWHGTPKHFAYVAPYLVAFSQNIIEVCHTDTGEISQAIHGEAMEAVGLKGSELFFMKSVPNGKPILCQLQLKPANPTSLSSSSVSLQSS
ncbi:CNH domain-containing protein [Chytridium lagenaria]|nr:CNH domain-containing protein [Chytridium lagenaria]